MRLIIGGNSNGKLERLKQLGYADEDISDNINCKPKVLYKLNYLVKSVIEQREFSVKYVMDLIENTDIEVIVCDEVGCGVVPIDRVERDYREAIGRVCCEIAKRAIIVERVYCGISTIVKCDENSSNID